MITLDELHNADVDEVREFGAFIQHVTRREQRPVAFVGAGLNMIEDTILSGTAITFFQRCSRFEIGRLGPTDTRDAILCPIEEAGSSIGPGALERATSATSGYPFMVQLVGFHSWKQAEDLETGITRVDVHAGARIARLPDLSSSQCGKTFREWTSSSWPLWQWMTACPGYRRWPPGSARVLTTLACTATGRGRQAWSSPTLEARSTSLSPSLGTGSAGRHRTGTPYFLS